MDAEGLYGMIFSGSTVECCHTTTLLKQPLLYYTTFLRPQSKSPRILLSENVINPTTLLLPPMTIIWSAQPLFSLC